MPSGAKKRKAAKKKTDNKSDNQSDSTSVPVHPHGEDDRESDISEVSSPMSQDHQKLPVEGEGEEIERDSEIIDPLSAVVEEGSRRVGNEIKIEDELGKKDESNKATYGGGGSSGSNSSSDDESRGIKKVESVELADSLSGKSVEPVCDSPTAEGGDSVVENIEKIAVSIVSPAETAVAPYVIEPALYANGNKICCSVKESIERSEPSAASHEKGEKNAQSAEITPTSFDQEACVTQENDDRSTSPYIDSTASIDDGAQHITDSEVTQRMAAPSSYPIQRTSWKGCCGLFEVFSSSSA